MIWISKNHNNTTQKPSQQDGFFMQKNEVDCFFYTPAKKTFFRFIGYA